MPNWFMVQLHSSEGPNEYIAFNINTQDMISKYEQKINFFFMSAPRGYLHKIS